MPFPPPRILLIDDHKLLRAGLRMILERNPGWTVVGEAGESIAALALAESEKPNVVIADIHLPGEDGIKVAQRILAKHPAIKVLFLSSDADIVLVRRALDAGGKGYLLKDNAAQDLIRAVEAAMQEGLFLCPEIAAALVKDYRRRGAIPALDAPAPLSERELEVLRCIAEGMRNKEIADELKISQKSVETYRSRLLKKLRYTSTAELVRHAVREGMIKA